MIVAALANAAPTTMSSDITGWIWVALIAFWIVSSIVGAIKRALAGMSRTASPPVTDRYKEAAKEVAAARTAIGAGTAQSATMTNLDPAARAQQLEQLVKAIETQAQAAQAAAAAKMQAAQSAAASASAAHPTPAASILPSLPARWRGTTPMQDAPQAIEWRSEIGKLLAPGGFAFAIVAAAVVGPCAAMRSEPQEPGGW